MRRCFPLCLLLLNLFSPLSQASDPVTPNDQRQYLRLSVDNLVIDTGGLVEASQSLALSIDRLALSIGRMADDSALLGASERESLLRAVASVERASGAMERLADELPRSARQLGQNLPRLVSDAREPIAELSSGLRSARDGVIELTRALPQATENAKTLVNSTLDSVLLRVSIFIVVLFAALAGATIWIVAFLYRSYLDPLARKLDALVGAPEHFADLAEYMKQTSDNMIALQLLAAGAPASDPDAAPADRSE